ncbi:MAG: helix-turn-helix transcriptional regulator [Oscillibacter sp.]|nr:helix-turn-helix transcriptional regulator [Oscillibacter sp.]
MLRYKMNLQQELKKAGYSTYRLRQERIIPESTLQKLRSGNTAITLESFNTICNILQCQPGDILEWVPEDGIFGRTQSGTVGTAGKNAEIGTGDLYADGSPSGKPDCAAGARK